MRSAVVFVAAILALVAAQQSCSIDLTPIQGTFSTSGVYSVVRTSCTTGGRNPVYTPTSQFNTTYTLTATQDGISGDLYESSTAFNQLNIGARMFIFILIDASGSQVPYLKSVTSSIVNGVRNGINQNATIYQNVTLAAAYFDGTEKITMLKDWDTNVNNVLDAITTKFNGAETYKPADNATNWRGAYDQALRSLEKQMNNSVPGLKVFPSGLIVTSGDAVDTAGSWYPVGSRKFYKPFWTTNKIAVQSGYRYGSWSFPNTGGKFDFGSVISWNSTVLDAANALSNNFASGSSSFAIANQGYWLAKWCSPIRATTYTVNLTEDYPDPNSHRVVFNIVSDSQGSASTDPVPFQSNNFAKGCDINAYVNSAQSVSVMFAVVVLAVAALF